jgi:tRNA dimethylallyltransferase
MIEKPRVICLLGPTASGKTQLAVELSQYLPVDIISVDSAMVYRGMDIGTAKPDPTVLASTPHRLINICDPSQAYSVADFRRDALAAIADSVQAERIPLLVGGSMLYFHVLQRGLAAMSAADPLIRQQILEQARQQGWAALHAELTICDPVASAKIEVNDKQRIQRALEVYRVTGQPLSQHWQHTSANSDYQFINLALIPSDRAVLHERIAKRVQQMLTDGLVAEVEKLMARGDLNLDLPALRCVGYRQVWLHLQGEFDYQTMQQRIVFATRQLAKRQLTWLRRWPDLHIIEALQTLPDCVRAVIGELY